MGKYILVIKYLFVGKIKKHMNGRLLKYIDLSACRLVTDRGLKYMEPFIEISNKVCFITVWANCWKYFSFFELIMR